MTGATQKLKVQLKGGGPWGFRLIGGVGTGLPLTVSKVRRKSKSCNSLQEGDVFLSVNGVPCHNLSYDQVMAIAEKCGSELNLELERKGSTIENAVPEIEPYSLQVAPTSTPISYETNVNVTHTETRTAVTKQQSLDVCSKVETVKELAKPLVETQELNSEVDIGPLTAMKTQITETPPCSDNSLKEKFEKSLIPSDVSIKTSSEKTPTSEKFEKLETEKIHEKLENGKKTIMRTDYEECVKSSDITSSPRLSPTSKLQADTKTQQEQNSVQSSVTRESYEILKSQETKVTTTKVNGFPPFASEKLPSFAEAEIKPNAGENKSSLKTDISMPGESFASTFSSYDFSSTSTLPFGPETTTKKKKMFSSSSFYEEPHAIYPTVEEQFEMAKKIAESLADDTNKKSKGANMFFKRAKRSTKWIHEGPEPSEDSGPGTPDAVQEPFYPEYYVDGSSSQNKPTKLKLVLDPRHPIDAASLRSTGHNISEHNVSPQLCHELVRDLESPKGKGSAMFAKRKKKSSEWVVDSEKVKTMLKTHEQEMNQLKPDIEAYKPAPFKSPWDTALEIPCPLYDRMNPDKLAETVIQAAENKRRDSIQSLEEHRYEGCLSPIVPATPAAYYYDIYKAKAPKGWSSPTVMSSTMPPGFSTATLPQEACSSMPYSTYQPTSLPRKYNFQNFNTLPRKWKSQHY